MDYYRLVFDALYATDKLPKAKHREKIYENFRQQVRQKYSGEELFSQLEQLEKVIRRQEMQAIHEESLNGGR